MARQTGMILLFCLIFLALLSLMAVSGLESVLLQERMEANLRTSRNGFAAAEAALREAETRLGGECPDVGAGISGNLPRTAAHWPQSAAGDSAWWQSHGAGADFPGPGERPRFHVESWRDPEVPQVLASAGTMPQSEPLYYRVTARAVGSGSTILQVLGVVVCDGAGAVFQTRLSWRQLR